MKKLAISLIIIIGIIISGLLLKEISIPDSYAKDKPRITRKGSDYSYGATEILVDNETGVMYLFVKNGYGAGLTVMLDEDGKPLLYKRSDT